MSYGENLRYCCDYYKSISLVCRKLGFNRQQFNKYLNGQSQPSRHNHKRLSDFFGLDYHELHMAHHDFASTFERKHKTTNAEIDVGVVNKITHLLLGETRQANIYTGYYFRYYHSKTDPTKLKRDLCRFYTCNGILYTSTRSRMITSRNGKTFSKAWNYRGAIALMNGRLFWLEFDRALDSEMTLSILIPDTIKVVTQIDGLVLGTGLDRGRRVVAGRLVLEYLGRSIDVRKALKSIGVFEKADPNIPEKIKAVIKADIPAGDEVLQLQ